MEQEIQEGSRPKRSRTSQRVDDYHYDDVDIHVTSSVPQHHMESQVQLDDKLITRLFEIGLKRATPKLVLYLMPEHKQLTKEHVKSRLQKFRLYSKRFSDEFLKHYHNNIEPEVTATPFCVGSSVADGDANLAVCDETPRPHGLEQFVAEVEDALQKLKEISSNCPRRSFDQL